MTSSFDIHVDRTSDWVPNAVAFRGDTDLVTRAFRLQETDASVERRVRLCETAVVARSEEVADDLLQRNRDLTRKITDLVEMAERAEAGEKPDVLAWQRLDSEAAQRLGSAELVSKRAMKLVADLADPVGVLDDLETRLPALRVRPLSNLI